MSDPTPQQIANLEAEIRGHLLAYHDLHAPTISDKEFDKLFERLQVLAPNSPVLSERSQSFDVDVPHVFPMGSLEKFKTIDEVVQRLGKYGVATITTKIDGNSIALRYDGGKLLRGVSRGRTETGKGKDITANVMMIPSIPKIIPFKGKCEVRGEGVITNEDWIVVQAADPKLSNPRNAASGGLQCQDPRETAARRITFVAYKVVANADTTSNDTIVDTQPLDKLRLWGFLTPKSVEADLADGEGLKATIAAWLADRASLPYWNDGIVIRIKDDATYNKLGIKGACPVGACAYKFENQQARTILRDIVWETGRLGFVTPVGIFDPVQLGGAKIKRCTLNNLDWMAKHGFPSIGAEITVEKCGDIIPGLASVDKPGTGGHNMPEKCPSCGAKIEKDGARMRCPNSDGCPAQRQDRLLNCLRKFEAKNVADSTLERLVEAGLVREPWDLLDLTVGKLVAVGFGKRQSEVIVEAVTDISAKPETIIAAAGVDGWGRRMVSLLVANSNGLFTPDRLVAGDLPYEDLIKVSGVGPAKAKMLSEAFALGASGRRFLDEMLKRVKVTKPVGDAANKIGGKLSGRSFLITGTLSKPRKHFEELITSNGGRLASGVSSKLDVLLVGTDAGSKLTKAQALGIKIIEEPEFCDMVK